MAIEEHVEIVRKGPKAWNTRRDANLDITLDISGAELTGAELSDADPSEADLSRQERECFAIMPITNPPGYPQGHFEQVFEDIVAPACWKAGFRALNPGKIRQTNLIHLDILQRLLTSPMAICDLSTLNPNVLFELGIRQAFDKPVVLIREVGTPAIFDIAPLRYTEYRRERVYREVLEDQEAIADAIRATYDACARGEDVNSIVRLLALTKGARLPDLTEADRDSLRRVIKDEQDKLRADLEHALNVKEMLHAPSGESVGVINTGLATYHLEVIVNRIAVIQRTRRIDEQLPELINLARQHLRQLRLLSGDPPNPVIMGATEVIEREIDREEAEYASLREDIERSE